MHIIRTLLFFLLLFGFGAMAGSFFTRGAAGHQTGNRRSVEAIVNDYLDRRQAEFVEGLGLTPEQLAASSPALEATRARLIAHQTEARRKVFQIMEQYRAELQPVLTPEQRRKLAEAMDAYLKSQTRPAGQ